MNEFRGFLTEWLSKRPAIDNQKDDVAASHAATIVAKLSDAEVAAFYLAIWAERQEATKVVKNETPYGQHSANDCDDPSCSHY